MQLLRINRFWPETHKAQPVNLKVEVLWLAKPELQMKNFNHEPIKINTN